MLSEANTDAYLKGYTPSGSSDTHYTYIRHRVGNPETSKYVQMLPDGHDFFPVRIKLYEVTPSDNWSPDASAKFADKSGLSPYFSEFIQSKAIRHFTNRKKWIIIVRNIY